MRINPLLLTDYYKTEHYKMYPLGTSMIYSNLTPRKSRLPGVDAVVVFGVQYFIKEYLIKRFDEDFFDRSWGDVLEEYRFAVNTDTAHIEALHRLGYLPIRIKSLAEGSLCPIRVPMLTIVNTLPDFFWLTNYLETLMSNVLWQPITSATIAYEYKKLLNRWARMTGGDESFVPWQGHDFSFRGMSSPESGMTSAMGHLLSFTGTDTIPAIYGLRDYYNGQGLIGASVPATEHSVMCMGGAYSEQETFERLLDLYPTGILSVVSDTWDLWHVLGTILPNSKDKIMARDGKLVIRPDSGDPADILCGQSKDKWTRSIKDIPKQKGVIELLWNIFGGTVNAKGYKVLDPHIGAIYGDSITLERAEDILSRLAVKGFASTNVVLGIGSYTYQYNTRDTLGFAVKATYGEVDGVGREIFKDPVTDDGTKKSAKGLLVVHKGDGGYVLKDQQTVDGERRGELDTVFVDGMIIKEEYLDNIRTRLNF